MDYRAFALAGWHRRMLALADDSRAHGRLRHACHVMAPDREGWGSALEGAYWRARTAPPWCCCRAHRDLALSMFRWATGSPEHREGE